MTWLVLAAALALPPEWSPDGAGGARHDGGAVACPAALRGFALVEVRPPPEPRFRGICAYAAADGRVGFVRLRTYERGAGETNQAIRNDIALMEPDPGEEPPAATARSGDGPPADGRETSMLTITVRVGNWLVDCQASAYRDGPPSDPSKDVSGYCFGFRP